MKKPICLLFLSAAVLLSCGHPKTDREKVLAMNESYIAFIQSNAMDSVLEAESRGGGSLHDYLQHTLPKKMALEAGFTSEQEAQAASDKYKDDSEIRALQNKTRELIGERMMDAMGNRFQILDSIQRQKGDSR